jgi:SET domain-containing protein
MYTYVAPSPLHGYGLFAAMDIRKGKRIADYKGIEMTLREFKELYGSDTRFTYSLRRENKVINGKDFDNPSHYCNESNEPTVKCRLRGLYTLVNVKKGQELLLRYPSYYPRDYKLQ